MMHLSPVREKDQNTSTCVPFFNFLLTGNLAQAEAVGREALELIPNDHSLMFSLANVLGKSQKYKVCKLLAMISCIQCQHLTEAINVSSAQLNSELGQNCASSTPLWLDQCASRSSCPKDGFVGSNSMLSHQNLLPLLKCGREEDA